MSNGLNLIGAIHAQTEPVFRNLVSHINDLKTPIPIPKSAHHLAGIKLEESADMISEADYLENLKVMKLLDSEYAELSKLGDGRGGLVVPTDLLLSVVANTRMVLLTPQPDNKYVLPPKWKRGIDERRSKVPSLRGIAIRTIDLREAYPNGIITSIGKLTSKSDYVQITLPEPSLKTKRSMLDCAMAIPITATGKLCTLADPRCLGITLHMAQSRPNLPVRPKDLDPGLVYVDKSFSVLFLDTFYHLSALEYGLLEQFSRIAKSWDARSFFETQKSRTNG